MDSGAMGVWDLRMTLETVHYSPQWKQRLGFPEPYSADSTHFWRCRVHPDDLQPMMTAVQAHASGGLPGYEARFRLRSNGSGYRLVHSRGRIVERRDGQAVRMVGTMIDLTPRPLTPQPGLPEGPRGLMAGLPVALPFHVLLGGASVPEALRHLPERSAVVAEERARLLALMAEVLDATLDHLDDLSGSR